MVFGRKKSLGPSRPVPPSVDQILDDLRSTTQSDPVFQLNPGLTEELVETAPELLLGDREVTREDLEDPNILYQKVVEYVAAGTKVEQLSQRITSGLDTLLKSQSELEGLTEKVKGQLVETRNKRKTVTLQQEQLSTLSEGLSRTESQEFVEVDDLVYSQSADNTNHLEEAKEEEGEKSINSSEDGNEFTEESEPSLEESDIEESLC